MYLSNWTGNRLRARANQQPLYRAGVPCKRGHYSQRFTDDGGCVGCEIDHCRTVREMRIVMAQHGVPLSLWRGKKQTKGGSTNSHTHR